jgi:hypothetical protein
MSALMGDIVLLKPMLLLALQKQVDQGKDMLMVVHIYVDPIVEAKLDPKDPLYDPDRERVLLEEMRGML